MRLCVSYHVTCDAAAIEARAQAIAVEQSVEMPLQGIDDEAVLSGIVGQVEHIADLGGGTFAVRIALAAATIGQHQGRSDAGQLLNMLFGNTSLHHDVVLADVDVSVLREMFNRPNHGISGLRQRLGAPSRALTGSALKPQGLSTPQLAELARRFALGGLDFIKDDHGLADQAYSRFADRVPACAAAIAHASGHRTRYIPSLTGNLDQLRAQASLARNEGLDCVMVAPMISGFAQVQALVAEYPDLAIFAHPSLGGLRIAPDLLIGKLLPLIGCDSVIFPSHGGRFGYSPAMCRSLAAHAREANALPVPAGGMTLSRVAEMLDFYGPDTMLLIGGDLLLAGEDIPAQAAAFARAVAGHRYA
jgi:ribulose-bisphosphate carboxylase large chain